MVTLNEIDKVIADSKKAIGPQNQSLDKVIADSKKAIGPQKASKKEDFNHYTIPYHGFVIDIFEKENRFFVLNKQGEKIVKCDSLDDARKEIDKYEGQDHFFFMLLS